MTKSEILRAFAELTPEDQEDVRTELAGGGKEEAGGAPMEGCGEIMKKMKAGGNPMEICKEMMGKMPGKCC